MSVGDRKGWRRRFRALQLAGKAPRLRSGSVHTSIERERIKAQRMAAAAGKRK